MDNSLTAQAMQPFWLAKHTSSDWTPNAEALLNKLKLAKIIKSSKRQMSLLLWHISELQVRGYECSIDVTELSGYHYHTGVVFNAYLGNRTTQTRFVRGGRFNGTPQLKA